MLQIARELDMLTIGYAFNADDTRRLMHEAAPDIFIFHAGITAGGTTGDAGGASLEETAARSEQHFEIAREHQARRHPARPRRGDRRSRATPSTCSTTPSCHGVQLGSSIERMAIERPLEERAAAFKAGRLPRQASLTRRCRSSPFRRADGRRRARRLRRRLFRELEPRIAAGGGRRGRGGCARRSSSASAASICRIPSGGVRDPLGRLRGDGARRLPTALPCPPACCSTSRRTATGSSRRSTLGFNLRDVQRRGLTRGSERTSQIVRRHRRRSAQPASRSRRS